MANAYAFCRDNPPPVVGHVGWAFEKGGRIIAGATERWITCPDIWRILVPIAAGRPELILIKFQGEDNAAWIDSFQNIEEVRERFRRLGYKWWKAYEVSSPHPDSAYTAATKTKDKGWWIFGNNCLDHAGEVLEAYGVPWQRPGGEPPNGMPWKQTNPAPIGWFHAWNVTEHRV